MKIFSLILIAFLLFSCKTRKVIKEDIRIERKDSVKKDSSKTVSIIEVKKDTSGSYTKTIIEYFEPSNLVPAGTPKKKVIEEWVKKGKTDSVNLKVEAFTNHSEIKTEKTSEKKKGFESKSNPFLPLIFLGFLILVMYVVFWRRY